MVTYKKILLLLLLGAYAFFTNAATLTVTNTADSGAGSLRDAISSSSTTDTIIFAPSTDGIPIILTSGGLSISWDLVIIGNGISNTILDGNASFSIFMVLTDFTDLTLNQMKLQNGNGSFSDGGAVAVYPTDPGILTLNYCEISSCYAASYGGAIYSYGEIHLDYCYVHDNSSDFASNTFHLASGGGASGLWITNSTISDTVSSISTTSATAGGTVYFENVTWVAANTTTLRITSSSINFTNVTMTNCTFVDVTILLGSDFSLVTMNCNLYNNLISNLEINDYDGGTPPFPLSWFVHDKNIVQTCEYDFGVGTCPSWYSTANPLLDPAGLQNNGGSTPTIALQVTSVNAIDSANATYAPAKDQRGFSRNGNPDIGAFEYNGISCPDTDTLVLDTICANDSIFLQGAYQNTTGTYYDTLSSVGGCDSVVATTLTVNPTYNTPASAAICDNDSIFLQGAWQTTAGTYYDTLSSVDGCDSVIATTLSINPTYNTPDAATICSNDSIFLQGTYQNTAGTYYDTLSSVDGCDSVIATTLTVNLTYNTPASATICDNDSILLEGAWQNTPGVYNDTLLSVNSCDSVVATTLIVNPTYSITDPPVDMCIGGCMIIYGICQDTTGIYYDSLITINGCDSVHSTVFTVNPSYSINTPDDTICDGDSVSIFGVYRTTAGIYYDSLTTANGCDSITTTTLNVNPTYSTNTPDKTICDGDSVMIFGVYRKIAGTYYDSLTTANSCDSVITTTLIVNPTYTITDPPIDMCAGGCTIIYGICQDTTGIYYDSLTTINGCDSVHSTVFTVNQSYYINTSDDTICDGDSIMIFGIYQTTAGIYYDSSSTVNGCDSVIATTLIVNSLPTVNLGADTMICNGCSITLDAGAGFSSYDWSTGEITQMIVVDSAGNYDVQVTDVNSCIGGDTIAVDMASGIAVTNMQNAVKIYPNPNRGEFTIEIDLQKSIRLSINIYQIYGKLIYSNEITNIPGNYIQQLDLSKYAKGIYYLRVVTDSEVLTKKVIYQ